MTTGAKLVLILFVGAAAGTATWYFTIYRPKHPKTPSAPPVIPPAPSSSSSGSTPTSTTTTTTPKPNSGLGTTPSSPIGKTAYAAGDGVTVFNSDRTIYKVAKKNEYIGTVASVIKLDGVGWYVTKWEGHKVVAGATWLLS